MNTNTRHAVSAVEEQLANASLVQLNVSSALNAARTVANAAPTSSAAPARCAAECAPKQPNGDRTMSMTITVYLFSSCPFMCARTKDVNQKDFQKTGVPSAIEKTERARVCRIR